MKTHVTGVQNVQLLLWEHDKYQCPHPREGDRFSERTVGGLCGEGFRKGKMEDTELGGMR